MVLGRWHSMATDPSSLGLAPGLCESSSWEGRRSPAAWDRQLCECRAGPLSFLAGRPWLAWRHWTMLGTSILSSTFQTVLLLFDDARPHRAGLSLVAVEMQVALAGLI